MNLLPASYPVIIFFLLLVYFSIPHRFKWVFLLIVSIGYYVIINQTNLLGIGLLFGSIIMDYSLAKRMPHVENPVRLLRFSLFVNLSILSVYKFSDLLIAPINNAVSLFSNGAQIETLIMPAGLSFYTFTKMGYVIDTYQKTIEPETQLGRFATFITFFPNIVSGPIEKARHFLPQLDQKVNFDETRIVEALRRILWGTFKKLVIANRLAVYVDYVYDTPNQYDGKMLLLATFFFTIQIYADFSGYTDIVLGVAKLFGYDLLENFNRPYFATSILDFWNRWHISLTAWIRGYLFMPISRRVLKSKWGRSPRLAQATAYTIIMALVALWHGTQLTFIIWGLVHAFYMVVLMFLPLHLRLPPKTTKNHVVRMLITFLMVSFAWIFFRATSLQDSFYIVTNLFNFNSSQDLLVPFRQSLWLFEAPIELLVSLILITILFTADWISIQQFQWKNIPTPFRWATYYLLLGGILVSQFFLNIGTQQFIYRQF